MRVKKWSHYAQNLRFVKSARKVKVKITRKIGDSLNCARKIAKSGKPIYAHILQISKSTRKNAYIFTRKKSNIEKVRVKGFYNYAKKIENRKNARNRLERYAQGS